MALKFGTDGVRAVAGSALTPEFAMKLGQAAGAALVPEAGGKILIGKDTRISSDMLEAALAAGLCSVGVDVILLGVIATPAVAHLMKRYGACAGIMVSASHNPFEHNGIKIFGSDGAKLSDAEQDRLTKLVEDGNFPEMRVSGEKVGRVFTASAAIEDYVDHLCEVAGCALSGIKVVFDGANGSASRTIERLALRLGLDATYLHITPDGVNINEHCGSTHPERLCEAVLARQADLGVAFDGDADRVIVVDEKGNVQDGDKLLAIFAGYMAERGSLKGGAIVGTNMSNMGLSAYCKEHGLGYVTTAVGDRHVMAAMEQGGYNLGGEQSGHLILRDHSPTGDGQLAAVYLLKILHEKRLPLSVLASAMEPFPQVGIAVKVKEPTKESFETAPQYQSAIGKIKEELGDEGRVVVRKSGTEPVIRVMVEGRDSEQVERLASGIAALLTELDLEI
ncbi:MAG TPA: phosphoglucosamine mutase [Candidatus Acidoferrum sp.]|nr:phosphoglucosamine mutase [Candidatus Acidoferrum sp.]